MTEDHTPRRPVGISSTDGGDMVICDDGSVWSVSCTKDSQWEEFLPIPGTARAAEREQERNTR